MTTHAMLSGFEDHYIYMVTLRLLVSGNNAGRQSSRKLVTLERKVSGRANILCRQCFDLCLIFKRAS